MLCGVKICDSVIVVCFARRCLVRFYYSLNLLSIVCYFGLACPSAQYTFLVQLSSVSTNLDGYGQQKGSPKFVINTLDNKILSYFLALTYKACFFVIYYSTSIIDLSTKECAS